MNEKMKHLEMIQAVIKRMADNSFLLKGWSVTLVTALFALAASSKCKSYYLLSYIPVLMFWLLDAFYHTKERHFRKLYDMVRRKKNQDIDFSMNVNEVIDKDKYFGVLFSVSLLPFYLTILIISFIAAWLL